MARRTRPLTVHDIPAPAVVDDDVHVRWDDVATDAPDVIHADEIAVARDAGIEGGARGARLEAFNERVAALRISTRGRMNERALMVLGGILAPAGLIAILLAWYGAANTPYVFEQVPYLISGGVLGVGLVFLGAFLYFAHWLTQLVKEQRAQSAAVLDALARLQDAMAGPAVVGHAVVATSDRAAAEGGAVAEADVPLVATANGTMAHRPDCVVVASRDDLREVTAADGLAPCKLCDPYG